MNELKDLIAAVQDAARRKGLCPVDLEQEQAAVEAYEQARDALEAELSRRRGITPADPLLRLVVEYGELCQAEPVENEYGNPAEATLIAARAVMKLDEIAALLGRIRQGTAASVAQA